MDEKQLEELARILYEGGVDALKIVTNYSCQLESEEAKLEYADPSNGNERELRRKIGQVNQIWQALFDACEGKEWYH